MIQPGLKISPGSGSCKDSLKFISSFHLVWTLISPTTDESLFCRTDPNEDLKENLEWIIFVIFSHAIVTCVSFNKCSMRVYSPSWSQARVLINNDIWSYWNFMSQASHFFFREQQTCWNLDFFIVQFNESKFPLLSPLSLTSLTRLRASVISATWSAFDRLNCSHSPNNILESHSNIVLQVLTLQLSHLLIILLYFCKSHHFSGCSFWNTFSTSGLDACRWGFS